MNREVSLTTPKLFKGWAALSKYKWINISSENPLSYHVDNGFSDGKRYSPLKWLGEGQHVAFSQLNQPGNADIKQNVTFKRNHSHNISRLLSV